MIENQNQNETIAPEPINLPPVNEPVFNNMPIGTLVILLTLVLIHIMRLNEERDGLSSWVIGSALIPQRFYDYIDIGMNKFVTFWPFVGYQLLHAGWFHLIMNCGMLIQAGPIAEIGFVNGANVANVRLLKQNPEKSVEFARAAFWFVIFFIICGIGGALGFMLFNKEPNILLMGASGSISGVFAGFLISAYNMAKKSGKILRLLSTSAIVFLVINVGGAAFARITSIIPIAWEAHLFGFITGMVVYPVFYYFLRRA